MSPLSRFHGSRPLNGRRVAADRLIFPNAESCLRLVRALAVEAHENGLEAIR